MLSLAPNLDENFLVESFLVITSKKISLLQDIATSLKSPFFIPYLSRADFILSKRIVEIENLTETSTPSNTTRTKRSTWGNFWSSVWGSATQEQLQNVYKTEADTAQQELEMQHVVSDVVKNSALVQNSLKGVTQKLGTLQHEQQNLLTEISDILVKEKQGITAVSRLAQAQDRTVMLVSEYSALHTQASLLMDIIGKTESLISTALTGSMNFLLLEMKSLRSLLPNEIGLSLQLAEVSFKFGPEGYQILFSVPRLSSPFLMYETKQLPIWQSRKWYALRNFKSKLIMNSNHDLLLEEDVHKYCTRHRKTYLCPQQTVALYHDQATSCLAQLVLTHYARSQPTANLSRCELEQIYYSSTQQYLMQKPRVYIANPGENETITRICPGNNVSQNDSLPTGLNIFTLGKGCRLETSQLQITGPLDVLSPPKDPSVIELAELGLIKTISLAETFLERGGTYTNDSDELTSLLTHYQDNLRLNGLPMNELKKQLSRLDSIDAIANFSSMGFKPRSPITTTVVGTAYWAIMLGITALALLLVKCFCPKTVSAMLASVFFKACCCGKRTASRPSPEISDSSSPIIRRRNRICSC
jgi:Baculovirus F protein